MENKFLFLIIQYMSLIVEIILVRQKRYPENTREKEDPNLTAIFSYFHTSVTRHCLVRHVVYISR